MEASWRPRRRRLRRRLLVVAGVVTAAMGQVKKSWMLVEARSRRKVLAGRSQREDPPNAHTRRPLYIRPSSRRPGQMPPASLHGPALARDIVLCGASLLKYKACVRSRAANLRT
ncbi:unnamed protein product [Gadus morhua 'NCC']